MILLSIFIAAAAAAACADNTLKGCTACLADTTCGWCDSAAAGFCLDKTALDVACAAPSTKVTDKCPDKCAMGTKIQPKNCKFTADFVPHLPSVCTPLNDPPTLAPSPSVAPSPTAAPDACATARAADGAACAQAMLDLSCSYSCQKCSDAGPAGKKLCKSVCDTLKAKCTNVVKDCGAANPFSDALCAADETDCVKDQIAAAPVTGNNPPPPPGPTPAGGTTATTVTIADCSTAKDCSTCANGGCQWCSLGMTSETAGTGTCVKTDATCASMYPQSIKSGAECKYDNEKTCEKSNDCKACTGAKANGVQCIWCDTGAKAGVSTGSCSVGPTCKVSSTTPTAADKCPASKSPASSVTIAVASLLVASLALFF